MDSDRPHSTYADECRMCELGGVSFGCPHVHGFNDVGAADSTVCQSVHTLIFASAIVSGLREVVALHHTTYFMSP
jgi:hypothetical protein